MHSFCPFINGSDLQKYRDKILSKHLNINFLLLLLVWIAPLAERLGLWNGPSSINPERSLRRKCAGRRRFADGNDPDDEEADSLFILILLKSY
jgi:hypothetical protein